MRRPIRPCLQAAHNPSFLLLLLLSLFILVSFERTAASLPSHGCRFSRIHSDRTCLATVAMASLVSQTPSVSRQEANALVRQVNRLLNRQLSSVCQVNGVKSTGIKAELQARINNRRCFPLLRHPLLLPPAAQLPATGLPFSPSAKCSLIFF